MGMFFIIEGVILFVVVDLLCVIFLMMIGLGIGGVIVLGLGLWIIVLYGGIIVIVGMDGVYLF